MTTIQSQPETQDARAKRYECRWRDVPGSKLQQHYWIDNMPSEPHWPDSAVMRWDMRQSDWDKIWPELIDHPCALLFAPRHPNREGAPRFRDWVESWPVGFAWKAELPEHLHEAIETALREIAAGPALKPEDQPAQVRNTAAAVVPAPHSNELLEQLAVALLGVRDADRSAVAQALSTLALAPDSGRTIEALKQLIGRPE